MLAMMVFRFFCFAMLGCLAAGCRVPSSSTAHSSELHAGAVRLVYNAKGILQELKPDGKTAVIRHEAISNYMPAMTMPFKAKDPAQLAGLQAGDEISFRLLVTEQESWIDQISKTGRTTPVRTESANLTNRAPSATDHHPLLDYNFTNELGQAVSLSQFKGQALAITFFFTRCPIPDFCPRLSKNFEEASRKLAALPAAPENIRAGFALQVIQQKSEQLDATEKRLALSAFAAGLSVEKTTEILKTNGFAVDKLGASLDLLKKQFDKAQEAAKKFAAADTEVQSALGGVGAIVLPPHTRRMPGFRDFGSAGEVDVDSRHSPGMTERFRVRRICGMK